MSVSVSMPQLGESVTEGTVTRWLKQEGERVEADEPLLEVSTDKVDTEIPSPVSGILRGITVAEDETVAVGAELAVIDEEGSADGAADGSAAAGGAAAGGPVAGGATTAAADGGGSSSATAARRPAARPAGTGHASQPLPRPARYSPGGGRPDAGDITRPGISRRTSSRTSRRPATSRPRLRTSRQPRRRRSRHPAQPAPAQSAPAQPGPAQPPIPEPQPAPAPQAGYPGGAAPADGCRPAADVGGRGTLRNAVGPQARRRARDRPRDRGGHRGRRTDPQAGRPGCGAGAARHPGAGCTPAGTADRVRAAARRDCRSRHHRPPQRPSRGRPGQPRRRNRPRPRTRRRPGCAPRRPGPRSCRRACAARQKNCHGRAS